MSDKENEIEAANNDCSICNEERSVYILRYHNITKDDMLNGVGLRTVLWLAGCNHYCRGCQNPITWDPNGGIPFDEEAEAELFENLSKPYIDGITFSGGDPLYPGHREEVLKLAGKIKKIFGKTIWLYTGFECEEICDIPGIDIIDVIVDGPYVEELRDVNYHWAGSRNQRIIDVKESLKRGCAIKYRENKLAEEFKNEFNNQRVSETCNADS